MKKIFYYQTNIGKLGIAEEHGFITNIYFMNMKQPLNAKMFETDILKEANTQINEYLNGIRKEFDLPLNPSGTSFQQTVWAELLNIPYGETRSYKFIAESIGKPNSARAVGSANNKNPIPLIIPCHRIIGVNDSMTGYVGGLKIKEQLLKLEKNDLNTYNN